MNLRFFLTIKILFLQFYYSISLAGITLDSQGERVSLGVYPLLIERDGLSELYVQVSHSRVDQLDFSEVAVRYSLGSSQEKHLVQLKYLPKEKVWRGYLGQFDINRTPLNYEVLAEDAVSEKVYKDDHQGSMLRFPYQNPIISTQHGTKRFQVLESDVVSPLGDKFKPHDFVNIQVKTSGGDGYKGSVRYSSDGWKTYEDAELKTSGVDGVWFSTLGSFPDKTKVEFATHFVGPDGKEIWDNNHGKNYSLLTGKDGFLPGEFEMRAVKEDLKVQPMRVLTDHTKEYLKQHKVYASMTTSPERFKNVHHVIETLDLEKLEKVFISIPKYFKNNAHQTYDQKIIDDLKARFGDKIQFIRPDFDLGPITKIIPAIEALKSRDPDAILISVDDDIGYPRGMVGELATFMSYHPGAVASSSGQDLEFWKIPRFGFKEQEGKTCDQRYQYGKPYSRCDVIEGFGSVAYRPRDIDTQLMRKLSQIPGINGKRSCRLSDDLVISFVLALSQISRYRVNSKYLNVQQVRPFVYGLGTDALHNGAGMDAVDTSELDLNAQKYRQCYRDLMQEVFDPNTLEIKAEYQKKEFPTEVVSEDLTLSLNPVCSQNGDLQRFKYDVFDQLMKYWLGIRRQFSP